jgi:oxalate---CoA ligase
MIENAATADLSGDSGDLTIADSIRAHAMATPDAPAVVFPDRSILTYRALGRQIDSIGAALRRAGIGAGKRVAIIVPDGPELAVAIVAVAANATSVPLNPGLTAAEFEALFKAQRLEAVILSDWAESAAREVAIRLGLCRLDATRSPGGFDIALRTEPWPAAKERRGAKPDDAAFILRTSGTTARPKLVPVTHRNLQAMAARLRRWYAIAPADRVLCVTPLYYAQALKSSLFLPLIAGGSIACPARSGETDFFNWLAALDPTWYLAGPTFHRAVLDRARSLGPGGFRHKLRFINSGAAPLPDRIRDGLEECFGVPVLDSYGISEAGPMAANSFAPEGRKRGTLGKPQPGELAIWSADAGLVGPDVVGEIVLRGPGVTPGYIDDPDADRAAFFGGWFHTGDLGRIDRDGFLTVVGRIKEMISRGGEKISPAEIDQALLRHPAIAEAAAFAVPHPRLGEDIAAAVVLRPGQEVTSLELRRYLKTSLAAFKIPRRIAFLDALPKGDTGKIRRQDLSRNAPAAARDKPSSPFGSVLEADIAEIWRRLLDRADIGPDDEFFELGGDSLLATQMILEVESLTGRKLPDEALFEIATPRLLAQSAIESTRDADQDLLVQLQPGTGGRPFIYVDGDYWAGGFYARRLAHELGPEYPFYDLRSHGRYGRSTLSIEQMAADYVARLRAARLRGPFRLGGHCNGALIAWELARQLIASGERVELVVMIEPITLNARPAMRAIARPLGGIATLAAAATGRREIDPGPAMDFFWRAAQFAERKRIARAAAGGDDVASVTRRLTVHDPLAVAKFVEYRSRMARYVPPKLAANVCCILAQSHAASAIYAAQPWRRLTPRLDTAIVPGDHLSCITTHVEALAGAVRERLAQLDRPITA